MAEQATGAVRNQVRISRSALLHNARAIAAAIAPMQIIAVVKADAYGMGLERCAEVYAQAGIGMLAVASIGEARRLRAVLPAIRILLLGSQLPDERRQALQLNCELCVSSTEEVSDIAAAVVEADGPPAAIHCFVDTGMGRHGCGPAQAVELVAAVSAQSQLRLAGLASHYPEAADAQISERQEQLWSDVCQAVDGICPLAEDVLVHLANSDGLQWRPRSGNAVRLGLLLSGSLPSQGGLPALRPALSWHSSLTLVKDLPAGHSVSYGCEHRLRRDTRVGLVPVGYADGYPLAASDRAAVVIAGQRCPVLGRVTMDYLVVDCQDLHDAAQVGMPVELLGPDYAVADLATAAGTIPYDILCGLRGRCEVVSIA